MTTKKAVNKKTVKTVTPKVAPKATGGKRDGSGRKKMGRKGYFIRMKPFAMKGLLDDTAALAKKQGKESLTPGEYLESRYTL